MYEQFSKLVPEQTLRERYKWHQEHAGEKRPYETWKEQTGLPELFRGYTFNQFGEHATELYTPEQLKVLDQVREYLGITGQ